jgi:hypothetical protein
LSADRQEEAEQTLKMMFDLGDVRPEEVRKIPRLGKGSKAILYAPLGEVHATPDAVLVACKPAGVMLLEEAAGRAGLGTGMPTLGRPTCMALPAAFEHGTITSLGCIGNRVYTGRGNVRGHARKRPGGSGSGFENDREGQRWAGLREGAAATALHNLKYSYENLMQENG